MKQVININFQGRVVPIEVSAFEILKVYIESLNCFFANEEGKEEIINDIENRIGELFQEHLKKGSTCITDDDVNSIIRSMGRPEDLETEESIPNTAFGTNTTGGNPKAYFGNAVTGKRLFRNENSKILGGVCSGIANYFGIDVVVARVIFVIFFGVLLIPYLILWVAVPSTASTDIGSVRKKLYRDSDDKIIGGVCSGIASYFGINVWIPRVIFLLPFLSFVSRWSHWDNFEFPHFLQLGFSPGALIIYIILWLVIPEAFSTAEKLEMKGEKVDMNSIKNSVMEEMKGVQQRAEKFSREARTIAQERGKVFTAEAGSVVRRGGRSLGDIIIFLFKIFAYFILGCIGFAFIMGLFGLGIVAIGLFPVKDFVLTDGWQNIFAWGTLIFFIAAPIIGIITWIIRRLAKMKSNRKTMRFSFLGLWLIGVVCFVSLIISVARDFRAVNTLNEQEVELINPAAGKLEITSRSPAQKFYRRRWFDLEPFRDMDEDTAMVQNISVHITKSPNDSFRVTMLKMANGHTRRYADTLASLIRFKAFQQDSLLVIDKGIPVTRKDKFRNQRVVITIYVPVGKQVRIDENVGWGNHITLGPWNGEDIDFEDLEEGWERNKDYIMRADGLYDLKGRPADSWKHSSQNDEDEDQADEDSRLKTDSNAPGITNNVYRYESRPAEEDSAKQKMYQDILKKRTDSIQRQKIKGDTMFRVIRKVSDNNSDRPMAYSLPGYNPLLMMN